MRIKTYDIQIKDSIFEPTNIKTTNKTVVNYKKSNEKTLYKIFLYLDGKDLPFVKKVKYVLHKSFKNPIKIIERNTENRNCKLVLWTWGIFNVSVEIEYLDGGVFKTNHYLTYGKEIEEKRGNNLIEWKEI